MDARLKRRLRRNLSIAPYLLVVLMSGGYVLKDIGTDIKEAKVVEDVKNDITIYHSPVIIDDIDDIDEELESEEEVEEVPKLSTELLDVGYEFEQIDFNELKKINEDSDAWIVINDTKIDLPIVTSTDNEYYLHHDIEKNDSKSGTLFIDYRNQALSSENLDDITFVYGHHMKGGKMFASICNYKDETFYKNHEYAVIYTPDGYAYKASAVACIVVDGDSDEEVFASKFTSKDDYQKYIDNITSSSLIETNETITTDDKLLALVTCTYERANARCIVYFKLEKQYTNINQMEDSMDKTLNRINN